MCLGEETRLVRSLVECFSQNQIKVLKDGLDRCAKSIGGVEECSEEMQARSKRVMFLVMFDEALNKRSRLKWPQTRGTISADCVIVASRSEEPKEPRTRIRRGLLSQPLEVVAQESDVMKFEGVMPR